MSTEMETKMKDHTAITFWGGDHRGVCVQVSAKQPGRAGEGFVQLTLSEASSLCATLAVFIQEEAARRQKLLQEQVYELNAAKRTVFHEVAELSPELMTGPELAVSMVDKFCPRTKPKLGE